MEDVYKMGTLCKIQYYKNKEFGKSESFAVLKGI